MERLPTARLTELQRLLEATKWLEAPGGEGAALHTDAGTMILAVTRDGMTRTVRLEGNRPAPYAALQRFLNDLAWQEDLYYRLTRLPAEGRRDALRQLHHAVEERLTRPAPEPARSVFFERFRELFTEVVEQPYRFQTEELRAAINLMALLKDKEQGAAIARMRFDRDPSVRTDVARALPLLLGEEAIPFLGEMIESTETARLVLIRMGAPAVATIESIIEPDVTREGRPSVAMIRAYIDHWQTIDQPIDPRVVKAVLGNMRRLEVRHRGIDYHQQLLRLAQVPEPKPLSVTETATAFFQHLHAGNEAELQNMRANTGSVEKWLAVRDGLAPGTELTVERILVDKFNAFVVSRPCVDKEKNEVRVVVFLNLLGKSDWLVGPAVVQVPQKVSYERQFRESHPEAKEPVP